MLVLVLAGFIAGVFFAPWPWGAVVVTIVTILAFLDRLKIYRRVGEGMTPRQARWAMINALLVGVVGNLVLVLSPMAISWYVFGG